MSSADPAHDDLRALLRDVAPLIDVRAPSEFAKGAPRGAVNLPILEDVERAAVGCVYHAHGSAAAHELGERLVSGSVRARRVERWVEHLRSSPTATLYCWRGGDRSRIAQQWLSEAVGHAVPRVAGGIKALRRAGIEVVERAAVERPWVVLGGRTGSGKTDLIDRIDHAIDLEGLANHRGSAFGALPGGQPTPIRFEFDLATALLRLPPDRAVPTVVEDEGFSVGAVGVPAPIVQVIRESPMVHLEVDLGTRVRNVYRDYVVGPLRDGSDPAQLELSLLGATDRIRSRLGAEQHGIVSAEIRAAFAAESEASLDAHSAWIRRLLIRYYDPLYDKQLRKQAERVRYKGDFDAVLAFLSRDGVERRRLTAG